MAILEIRRNDRGELHVEQVDTGERRERPEEKVTRLRSEARQARTATHYETTDSPSKVLARRFKLSEAEVLDALQQAAEAKRRARSKAKEKEKEKAAPPDDVNFDPDFDEDFVDPNLEGEDEAEEEPAGNECPHCDFRAASPTGLAAHIRAKHQE